jgi:hypothetical protein
MVNRMRPVLTEHLRTAGEANCTQIARLRLLACSITQVETNPVLTPDEFAPQ